jgi:DNA-binding transcriptional LysR family regulator
LSIAVKKHVDRVVLRHLRYFSAVVDHGSIVGASKALSVAQPSLTRQIHALELAAGAPLLERTPRGVRLTADGTLLLGRVRTAADCLTRALHKTRLAHDGRLGTLRLALSRGALQSSRVGTAVAALRDQLPEVELDVRELRSIAELDALLADVIDLSISSYGRSECTPGVRRESLFDDPVDHVLVSATHPLAGKQRLEPAHLQSEDLIVIEPAPGRQFPELYEGLRALHRGPMRMHRTMESVYGVVAGGRGWTVTTSAAAANPPHGMVALPLDGLHAVVTMGVSRRANDRSRLVANAVMVLIDASADRTPDFPRSATSASEGAGSIHDLPRGLEVTHLRAFVAAMAEPSVARAAARIGITQSGLSRRIHALELEINAELFRHTRTGLTATAAAVALHAPAVAALSMLDEAFQAIGATCERRAAACRIGALPVEMSGDVVPGVIRRMHDEHPNVPIEVAEALGPQQVAALRSGDIDIGITSGLAGIVDDPSLASVYLDTDVIDTALVSTTHPLGSHGCLGPEDLADIPFLFIPRPAHPKLYDAVMRAFAQAGITPRIQGTFNGPRAAWRLAADGLGWTIGTRRLRTNPPSGLVGVPISGLQIPSGIQLLWRRDEQDPHVLALLDMLRFSGVANNSRPDAL